VPSTVKETENFKTNLSYYILNIKMKCLPKDLGELVVVWPIGL
jgi:hypothetical protein